MIVAVISIVIVIIVTVIITRLAALALTLTGMSQESARFQARSALAGVGFTTKESESVVNHPLRRRIIMMLMLTGSIGMPTVIATIVVSVLTTFHAETWWRPAILLAVSLTTLMFVGRSRWVEANMNKALGWALKKWTRLDVRDYVSLLQLQNGFAVSEMLVDPGDWLEGKTLQAAALAQEGYLVLGIERSDGNYIGAPRAADMLQAGDKLVIYCRLDRLKQLDERRAASGDAEHRQNVAGRPDDKAKSWS